MPDLIFRVMGGFNLSGVRGLGFRVIMRILGF